MLGPIPLFLYRACSCSPGKHTYWSSTCSRAVELTERGTMQSDAILIVDDDPNVRVLVATVLGEYGFTLYEASSGEEALRIARHHPPRVALIDVRLPGLSGYEVCRKLKDDFAEDVAVMFISGERRES